MNFPLGLKLGCRATGERYVCPTARRALDISPHLLFVLLLLGYRRSVVFQLDDRVITAIERHASVGRVRLIGSRAEGRATARSDWDFLVETDDFATVATDLPTLCAPLAPVAQQWDRLSSRYCWMLILSGPVKIDLIFADQPHERESPWVETAANLTAIDRHFWDWTLWLSGKSAVGKSEIVASELGKLFEHILAPLGVERRPSSVAEAVTAYRTARRRAEKRFGCHVPRELETAVAPALSK
jgi:predicted nucleotidyltransferase